MSDLADLQQLTEKFKQLQQAYKLAEGIIEELKKDVKLGNEFAWKYIYLKKENESLRQESDDFRKMAKELTVEVHELRQLKKRVEEINWVEVINSFNHSDQIPFFKTSCDREETYNEIIKLQKLLKGDNVILSDQFKKEVSESIKKTIEKNQDEFYNNLKGDTT